jgi:hypothetical protein
MAAPVLCKNCNKRRARRYCPAASGEICPLCCGTHREIEFTCPLDCEYLQEAHRHEKPVPVASLPYPEISVDEEFLSAHEQLFLFCAHAVVEGAMKMPGAVDEDIAAALDALIQTYRTLESGLVYETRAENSIAAGIQRTISEALKEYEREQAQRDPLSPVRNNEILKMLVFLHRLGSQNRNGRLRGRMYFDLLHRLVPPVRSEERAPSIIL